VIGAMDIRAVLQNQVRTGDGGGGFSESWSNLATVWIALEVVGAQDVFGPDRQESRTRYRVRLRRRGDVAAGMRLTTAARILRIYGVLDEGPRAQAMTLLCEDAS
jgi:SPP1 family predicted phage head-tail adaptor